MIWFDYSSHFGNFGKNLSIVINIYSLKEPKKPSFFERLFRKPPKINAFIEVNNLLADHRISDISIEQIEAIANKYKTDISKSYKSELKDLYVQYLQKCYRDNLLSEQEFEDLKKLKEILLLSNSEVRDLQEKFAKEKYKESYESVVSDGKIDESEKEFLERLREGLMLPEKIAEKIGEECRLQLVNGRFKSMTDDSRVSPEEWEKFNAIAKNMDVTVSMNEATKGKLERFKLYWEIENGELPVKFVGINLQRGENCYYSNNVEWYEKRTITKRINYGGPVARIRIAKGLYYRVGSVDYEKVSSEQIQLIDTGEVFITNKRIIFIGRNKNINIPLNKILSLEPYRDGVGIIKATGRSPIITVSDDADILVTLLSRVINDSN